MTKFKSFGVIGGGAWGTALAQSTCLAGCDTTLWAREEEIVSAINTSHENAAFLPGISLDPGLKATTSLEELAGGKDALLMVAPAQYVRHVAADLARFITAGTPVIICAKGIETASGKLMSEVVSEAMPTATPVILSGPSFASDVARGLPTAVKNVLAIAAGIVQGKQLGASAHASLISRGFAELTRFGESFGANPKTMRGLSGLGDLVLTCSSPQSRNMSLGIALGEGQSLQDILKTRNSVSEGVHTAAAVARIVEERQITMPIADAVHNVITETVTIDDAIATLLSRPLRSEG